jgi:hypothetical protein
MSTLSTTNLKHPSSASNNIVLDSSARVLVGTSTSRTVGDARALQVEGTDGATAGLSVFRNSNNSSSSIFALGKSRGTAAGGTTVVQSGDGIGEIQFWATDGTNPQPAAIVKAEVDGTPGTNDMPGRLVFSTTADGAASPTERMRITSGTSDGAKFLFNCISTPDATTKGFGVIPNSTIGNYLASSINTTASNNHVAFYNPNGVVGTISTNASATAYNTSSDYRLKENVAPIIGAAARILQLKPSRFNFIADPDHTVDGFIAHEAQAVVPECVTGEKDAVDDDGKPVYQGIDQSKLVPLLTAALQEAVAEIKALKDRVTALESA